MVMLQTLTVGLIVMVVASDWASLFGMALLKKGMPPFFLPWQLPLITLGAILFHLLAGGLARPSARSETSNRR